MSWPSEYLRSSIGQKQTMAVSGLLLCGFLVTHLLGNFLLYVGAETFNTYGYKMLSNPLVTVAEVLLALLFLVHIIFAIRVTMENQMARTQRYFLKMPTGRGATFASSTMPYTGAIILIFLVLHLLHFRFGEAPVVEYNGQQMRDLYYLVIELFSHPIYVLWYIFAQLALGLHISHGFASAFETLGFYHPKYTPLLKIFSIIFAILITLGFSSIPVWAYLKGGK